MKKGKGEKYGERLADRQTDCGWGQIETKWGWILWVCNGRVKRREEGKRDKKKTREREK